MRDFALDAAARVPAGPVTLRVVNRGAVPHRASLLALSRPDALVAFFSALRRDEPLPSSVRAVAEGPSVAPGRVTSTPLLLPAGEYLIVCLMRGADGVPHVMRGMVRPLRVEGDVSGNGRLPPMQP